MNNGAFIVLDNKDVLFDYCENMEELYDKFYYPLLIEYSEIKKQKNKEIDRLNNIINELENTIANFIENHTESYIDWKYDRKIYLAESNILQKLFDTYLDKLKALKENNNEF